ncbi:MAG: DUF4097 family beta strand repeat protein [Firmicutes bacterium]|nr:DUF4097 family beta strand repeat protein [Bacillota bacterium]
MEEKIRAHMEKLFVSAPKTEAARELKEEMLQNVLDKYQDLVAEGRTPDEAYLIAIRGIGDISGLIAGLGPGQVSRTAGENRKPSEGSRFDAFTGNASASEGKNDSSSQGSSFGQFQQTSNRGFQAGKSGASPFEVSDGQAKKLNPTTKTILIIVGAAVALIFIVLMISKSMIENLRYQRDAAGSSTQTANADSASASGKDASAGEVFNDVTIRKIKVEWVAGAIVIKQGTYASYSVDEPSGLDQGRKTSYEINGDELIIKEYSESWNFSLGINLNSFKDYPSKTLTLTLPESLKELEIETVSAPVVIEKGAQVGELDIESVSANLSVKGVNAKDIDLACVSGDVELYLESAPKEISVENVSGDNTLYIPESVGFTLETESISGDTNVNLSVTNRGNLMVHGDGSCNIKMETVSGEMNVSRFE